MAGRYCELAWPGQNGSRPMVILEHGFHWDNRTRKTYWGMGPLVNVSMNCYQRAHLLAGLGYAMLTG